MTITYGYINSGVTSTKFRNRVLVQQYSDRDRVLVIFSSTKKLLKIVKNEQSFDRFGLTWHCLFQSQPMLG